MFRFAERLFFVSCFAERFSGLRHMHPDSKTYFERVPSIRTRSNLIIVPASQNAWLESMLGYKEGSVPRSEKIKDKATLKIGGYRK
ncbi:MAG: hypothetical protein AAFN10_07290 [Bacteroidota bacterium]